MTVELLFLYYYSERGFCSLICMCVTKFIFWFRHICLFLHICTDHCFDLCSLFLTNIRDSHEAGILFPPIFGINRRNFSKNHFYSQHSFAETWTNPSPWSMCFVFQSVLLPCSTSLWCRFFSYPKLKCKKIIHENRFG